MISERAIVTRRFMPPDSGSTLLVARSVELHELEQLGRPPLALGARDVEVAAVDDEVLLDGQLVVELVGLRHDAEPGADPPAVRSPGRGRRRAASPSVTGDVQPIIRIVDDLPAPFGPRNPNASPRWTSTSMPSTAVKSPKRLTSPRGLDHRGDAIGADHRTSVTAHRSRRASAAVLEEAEVVAGLGDVVGGDVGEQDRLGVGGGGQQLAERVDDPAVAGVGEAAARRRRG